MRPLLIFFTIALLVACKSGKEPKDNYFILKGQLENAENTGFVIEELTPRDLIPIDSIFTCQSGSFAYRKEINDAGFYILRINRDNSVTLLIEPGEVLEISGDANDIMSSINVTGSQGTSLMLKLNRKLAESYYTLDSLADLYRESRYLPDFDDIRVKLNAEYKSVIESHREFVKTFIKDNPKSLASIIALNQYLGDIMLITMSGNFKYFEDLSNSLSQVYPSNKHVIDLKKQITNFKRRTAQRQMAEEQLAIGNKAPEIVINNPDGKAIALSSLEGNVVLIDFWASWCNTCRENNKRLRHLYDTFNSRGFEIYGISLDQNSNSWLKAIEEDEINWLQLSDLRFWNSPVVKLYNIDGIPYNFLIDKDRRIIAKGLSISEIEEILIEIL